MMHFPPIYPITDARLAMPLAEQVRHLGVLGFPLVQFRGKPLDAREQWLQLRQALLESADNGGWPLIVVNDRSDLAVLAAQEGFAPWGLHLGQDDLPPSEARRLPGLEGLHIGTSTHDEAEWQRVDPACDHAGCGPFRGTATKGDHAEPMGLEGLRIGCGLLRARDVAPIAIGGLTLGDARDCFEAGAESLAMVGEIWSAPDPAELLWEAQCLRWRQRPAVHAGRGVLIVGGSGGGKSTLAKALAPSLGLPLVDLDDLIEERTGTSIPDIFAYAGETGFRDLETRHMAEALRTPCVLCLGAGAWQREENRVQALASGFACLWLAESPHKAWDRVAGDPHRPLAQERATFMARWRSRIAAWSRLPMVLPLGRGPEELVEAMLGHTGPLNGGLVSMNR
ncbi:shikimate kinase [Holophaga foetida]|uniref:shikimate kinase n=1 Tax=Holophaga foetida TaxID=35839 RepID=UPI0002472EB7|nr:shikimate kinase [Holophaga foetida]